MNMTEHKHAAILRAIAEGQTRFKIQYKTDGFRDCNADTVLRRISEPEYSFTIRPNTIQIGNLGVEAGLTSPPPIGSKYFSPDLGFGIIESLWDNDATDKRRLSRGIVFLTYNGANDMMEALHKLLTGA